MSIVAFLEGRGLDTAGRTFERVLAYQDSDLEIRHDFIQWLFPLDEPSRAVPDSPVLTADDIEALRGSPEAQDRLRRAARRMLRFYAATSHWRTSHDHNHLRITRIIKSLRLLAGAADADAFKAEILRLAVDAPIAATARRFWAAA